VNDWLQFTLPNVAAGSYTLKFLYKSNNNRGIVQATLDGASQGSPCDEYAAAPAYQVACSLGTKTLTAGNHTLRFTVTGKNASSSGFMIVIDQISLTASGGSPIWVGTWSGAPQLTETANLPPASLTNAALRQVVHVSVGGSQLKVRFSNEFGNGPVTINAAHVAVCRASPVNSTIDTTTDRGLTFSGSASVTIAAGQAVWSDALGFTLAPLSNLSVTVAFGSTPSNVTGHPGSRTTSYLQSGSSNVSAASMTSALTTDHWYILSGVDTFADAKAIAILGDSITDGRGKGLRVYGATITPFGSNGYYTPAHETVRQTVNTYIRSGKFDAFIDFDAAVRDTSNPPKLQAGFDSGDGLHLNPSGYQKLADTVNLTLFAQ